jgi:hypothetical protein
MQARFIVHAGPRGRHVDYACDVWLKAAGLRPDGLR